MADTITRYGWQFPADLCDLEIEFQAIRYGGWWRLNKQSPTCGNGLYWHYKRAHELLWPEDDFHRWAELLLQTFLNETITVVQGGKDSSKTRSASKFALVDFWAYPDETLIFISSTEMRGADYRIWGDLKSLFIRALDKYDWLPGKVLEAKHAICTDDLEDGGIRDPRKGLVFIPCFGSGGSWVGLSRYAGIKQKRRRLIGDEVQFMLAPYVDVLTNLNSGDFKGIFLGNPIGQNDPLDKLGEPIGGWGSEGVIKKTTTWKNKFGGTTICLYGPDSPNFDYPQEHGVKRYPYLIGQKDIDWVKNSYGDDSHTFWMQVMGVRRAGLTARRVITRATCEQHGALDACVWSGGNTTMIAGLDAAYGGVGGDRCVLQIVEFGPGITNAPKPNSKEVAIPFPGQGTQTNTLLKCFPPVIVPVSVSNSGTPEDQIATFCKNHCESMGVLPENFFFDGRGTVAIALAKIWSPLVNSIEFGGAATKRNVSQDHWTYDVESRQRRLKRCDEEYSKFVTELWFSVRYAIESGQVRELPSETMEEGCQREWKLVTRDRKEVETKADMKKRTNRSPDLFDGLVICCEGARRRGFQISKMSNTDAEQSSQKWIDELYDKSKKLNRSKELVPV